MFDHWWRFTDDGQMATEQSAGHFDSGYFFIENRQAHQCAVHRIGGWPSFRELYMPSEERCRHVIAWGPIDCEWFV